MLKPVENPDNFAFRLGLALKVLNISRGHLSAQVGVDKSLVSRWLSGQVVPTGHNLSRISEALAKARPGFNALLWERPCNEFESFIGLSRATQAEEIPTEDDLSAIVPPALIAEAWRGTERNGAAYEAHWAGYRPQGAHAIRNAALVTRHKGLLRLRVGEPGFDSHGWLLPIQEHLFGIMYDVPGRTPNFAIMNAVAMPRVEALDGIILSQQAGGVRRTPAAFPIFLERVADLCGDEAADLARYNEARAVTTQIPAAELKREDLRKFLFQDFGPTAAARGGYPLLMAPMASSLGFGVLSAIAAHK